MLMKQQYSFRTETSQTISSDISASAKQKKSKK